MHISTEFFSFLPGVTNSEFVLSTTPGCYAKYLPEGHMLLLLLLLSKRANEVLTECNWFLAVLILRAIFNVTVA